jgi:hypothetical protein
MTIATATEPRANYFVRHWRGELSLPVSYWVNGVLLGIGLAILAFAIAMGIATGMQGSSSVRPALGIFILVAFAADVVHIVWGGVGVWRSATNYRAQGRPAVWAILAKIAVVLGAIRTAVEMLGKDGFPLVVDLLRG